MASVILFIKKSVSWILVLVSFFGSFFTGKPQEKIEGFELVKSYEYSLDKGMSFAQGIATDGEYFYGFGAIKVANYNAITKIDAKTGEIVAMNEMCIPPYLMNKGYSHLGDGCCYKGKLYIGCEDRNFENPAVMIYDAETLEFIESKIIPAECKGDGHLPWCTVCDDVLYFCSFSFVEEIKMLDINDNCSYIGSIPIDTMLHCVQGGDIVDGILYLSSDDGEQYKPTYKIDLATGKTETFCTRDTGSKSTEAEGLTVYPFDDGTNFHYVDCTTTITVRNYKVDMK